MIPYGLMMGSTLTRSPMCMITRQAVRCGHTIWSISMTVMIRPTILWTSGYGSLEKSTSWKPDVKGRVGRFESASLL